MTDDQVPSREGTDYQWDLWNHLEGAIQNYEDARQEYWESRLASEDWSALNQLRADADQIAVLIRKRALALQNLGHQSDLNLVYNTYHEKMDEARASVAEHAEDRKEFVERLRKRLPADEVESLLRYWKIELGEPNPEEEGDDPLRLVWERLCIDDACDVVWSIHNRVRRIFELERLIYEELGEAKPPEASVRFLSLISRNYIYGFATECVVMCRSALDTAFREKVTDEHCERADVKRGAHFTFAGRIKAAFHNSNNLLAGNSDLYRAAQIVKDRGDKAVHYDPEATKDVLGTIRNALRVINALSELQEGGLSEA